MWVKHEVQQLLKIRWKGFLCVALREQNKTTRLLYPVVKAGFHTTKGCVDKANSEPRVNC
jgi:hypothetical protein